MTASAPGDKIREARKRRGLTQRELADLSGLSISAVKKIEQGSLDLRLETARKVAVALKVPTMTLVDPEPPGQRETTDASIWTATRNALISPPETRGTLELATERGTADVLLSAVKLYHDNQYDRLARVLPALLRDAHDTSPLLRSRIMQLAGSVMTQTRQHDAARIALETSMTDADATGSEIDAASTIITMCWLLLVEGQFEQVRNLAATWADRVEPRLSAATVPEISAWGWLLLRGSAAAIRDNRPGEAADMMRLAEAAAVAAGPDSSGGYRMYWTNFGPATVAMKRAENAIVDGRPDTTLRLAAQIPHGLRPTSDNRNRHLLDVSAAHAELRHYDDAVDVLKQLHATSGPWLEEQRMARDILSRIVHRRRTLTPDMRELANAIRLPL